jgi:dCMP deaminase
MKSLSRPLWDAYFMEIAHVVKTRSNCLDIQIGSVIVREKRIIATGYNGTPMGITNCNDGGCERCKLREEGKLKHGEKKDLCICVHAEQNALLQSAYHGISTKDSTFYTTASPCSQCAKMIINAGVKKVVAHSKFPDELGPKLLQKAHIEVVMLTKEKMRKLA